MVASQYDIRGFEQEEAGVPFPRLLPPSVEGPGVEDHGDQVRLESVSDVLNDNGCGMK